MTVFTHVRYLTEELLFSFHTRYRRCLAVLPPVWRGHSLHGARQDFILMHILYTRHDAVNTLYPNPNISAQQSSLSFFFALHVRYLVYTHLSSSTYTTHYPHFIETQVAIHETYPTHIFLTRVLTHPSSKGANSYVHKLYRFILFTL